MHPAEHVRGRLTSYPLTPASPACILNTSMLLRLFAMTARDTHQIDDNLLIFDWLVSILPLLLKAVIPNLTIQVFGEFPSALRLSSRPASLTSS